MEASRGPRIIEEHGLISNILLQLSLLDQTPIANIWSRPYEITAPWNIYRVGLPTDPLCDFPNLKIPSNDHVCKRMEATIEGKKGIFYGIFY